jgi:hypothetical protein
MTISDSPSVRFVDHGAYPKDVEVCARLRCRTDDDFLASQGDILLRTEDIVSAAGTGFAWPAHASDLAGVERVDAAAPPRAGRLSCRWRCSTRLTNGLPWSLCS